jgi:hypothetical protein
MSDFQCFGVPGAPITASLRIIEDPLHWRPFRMAYRSRKAPPDQITRYARNLRIWTVIRPYLESLAADEG